jgi:hypothetical protein
MQGSRLHVKVDPDSSIPLMIWRTEGGGHGKSETIFLYKAELHELLEAIAEIIAPWYARKKKKT